MGRQIRQIRRPPLTEAEIQRRLEMVKAEMLSNIERTGFSITGVFPTEALEHPPFNYTIGLTKSFGIAEMVVSGVSLQVAGHLFHAIVGLAKAGKMPPLDQPISEIANVPVVLKRAELKGLLLERMRGTVAYYRDLGMTFQAVQMVWPDPQGNFPWDEDYDGTMPQELLYL